MIIFHSLIMKKSYIKKSFKQTKIVRKKTLNLVLKVLLVRRFRFLGTEFPKILQTRNS